MKLAALLGVCAVCLFLVPATFAQGPVIKVIDVDTNAFARGGLTDGGSLTLSLSVDRIPSDTNCGTGVCGTLGAFVFSPSSSAFTFSTTALRPDEFAFGANVNTARLHTTVPGSGRFAAVTLDVRWTATSPPTKTTISNHINTDTSVFDFKSTSEFAVASISGTVNSTMCCTFNTSSLSKNAHHEILIVHP